MTKKEGDFIPPWWMYVALVLAGAASSATLWYILGLIRK